MPRISHIKVYPRASRGYTVEYLPYAMRLDQLRMLRNLHRDN